MGVMVGLTLKVFYNYNSITKFCGLNTKRLKWNLFSEPAIMEIETDKDGLLSYHNLTCYFFFSF